MRHKTIPLIVLGGRDRHTVDLPDAVIDRQALSGYKGARLRIGGRPLIVVLIDRLRATGVFDPIFIAGPSSIYGDIAPDGVTVHDTDGSFGQNLRFSVEKLRVDLKPTQVAVATCDILPDPAELQLAADDLVRNQPLDFWFPLVRVPQDKSTLGTSDWKPRYRLQPPGASQPVPILPSHILACNVEVTRLRLVYRLFDMLYATRNRPVVYRSLVLMRRLLWSLFLEDVKHMAALRRPHILGPVVGNSLVLANMLRNGKGTTTEWEDRIRRVFIRRDHARLFPTRRGRVPVIDALSLARDIDTLEEAAELVDSGCLTDTTEAADSV